MRADRARLRLLLAVPRAGRPPRGRAGGPRERGDPRQVATGDDAGPRAGRRSEPGAGPAGRARRWDTDERGIGVADATAWRQRIATLADLAVRDGWVAEDPELHLLAHLEAATSTGPLALGTTTTDAEGTFVVDLDWTGSTEPNRRDVRAALFGLIGTIAESVTLIEELPVSAGREVEVLTGVVGSESPFATHGHTLRFRVAVATGAGNAP